MRMRLGTTSFIYPMDILHNVRHLADKVDDIELVIFEAPGFGDNYPDKALVKDLCRIASSHDLSYTVHLPLDLKLAEDEPLLDPALRVIDSTRELEPFGYIVHLDGTAEIGSAAMDRWLDNATRSLECLAKEAGGAHQLCVENLDDQPPAMLDRLLEHISVSCCADIGHLWKQQLDPVPCLDAWLARTRVVHLHGVGTRDHKGLSLVPQVQLDPVVSLLATRFQGVITFEVFSESDFLDCQVIFGQCMERIRSISPTEA
jgi:sugar phosphate isomerase/epimerase